MATAEVQLFGANLNIPDAGEQALARVAHGFLQGLSEGNIPGETGSVRAEVRLRWGDEEATEAVALPPSVVRLLVTILEARAKGQAVTIVPDGAELSPNQAADLLGVSRPYLVRLLDEGRIPFRRVGAHRRIPFEALRRYQEAEEERQLAVLGALQEQAQELKMGY